MIPEIKPVLTRRAFLRLFGLAWLGGQATGWHHPVLPGIPITCRRVARQLAAPYTFDSFVVRPHNQEAFAAAWAVAQKPFFTYNPLFIHGAAGLGRTHLLLALGQHLAASDPHRRVLYLPATRFSHLADEAAVGPDAAGRFCNQFRQADVVLMDDVHHLTDETACDFVPPDGPHRINGAAAQNVLRELFSEMYSTASKLFVFSSVCAPDVIPGLSRHLVQGVSWGVIAEIRTPETGMPF